MNSRLPEDRPVLFIDRNLGRHILAKQLRAAAILCEVHDDHLPQNTTDEDWLQLVGKKGWIAIGRDKNIRYRGPEKAALIQANARLIVVRAKNTTGQDIADILIKHIALISGRRKGRDFFATAKIVNLLTVSWMSYVIFFFE